MSFSIQPNSGVLSLVNTSDGLVQEDIFPTISRLESAKLILKQGDCNSYIRIVKSFDLQLETFSPEEMLSFMREDMTPFLSETVTDKDLQMIKLTFYLSYIVQKRVLKAVFDYDQLRQEIAKEFQNVPLDYWLSFGFQLLTGLELSENEILDEIIHIFIGKPEDTWSAKLDFLLEYPQKQINSFFFLRLIEHFIKSKEKIEWTPKRLTLLRLFLENHEISFENCSFIFGCIVDPSIEKAVLGKLLAEESINSDLFLLLMMDLLPTLKERHPQLLIDLSQRSVLCDEESANQSDEYVDLRVFLSESGIESFRAFFAKAEESIRLTAYRNMMTCVHFYWKVSLEPNCHDDPKNLLDLIHGLNLNGTFDYLEYRQKVTFLIFIETIQSFIIDRVNSNLTLPNDLGCALRINESWVDAAIFFFTYQRTSPISSEEAVAFVLDTVLFKDLKGQFAFLSALKNEMRHLFFLRDQSPNFVAAMYVVFVKYAQHPLVQQNKDFLEPFLTELEVAFRLQQFTFRQGLWIAELLKEKNRPLTRVDAKILVETFFDEEENLENIEFYKYFVAMYKVLISPNFDSLEFAQLQKVEKLASFSMKLHSQAQETLKIQDQIKERLEIILKIFELLKIDEMFLVHFYRRLINKVESSIYSNNELVNNKILTLKGNKLGRNAELHEIREEKKSKEKQLRAKLGQCVSSQKLIKFSFNQDLLRSSAKPERKVSSELIDHKLISFSQSFSESLEQVLEELKKKLNELEQIDF